MEQKEKEYRINFIVSDVERERYNRLIPHGMRGFVLRAILLCLMDALEGKKGDVIRSELFAGKVSEDRLKIIIEEGTGSNEPSNSLFR